MCVWLIHAHCLHLTLCTIWLQNCIWAQLSYTHTHTHTHTHTQTQLSNLCWDCILDSPSAMSAVFSASASLLTFSLCAARPNTWLNWQSLSDSPGCLNISVYLVFNLFIKYIWCTYCVWIIYWGPVKWRAQSGLVELTHRMEGREKKQMNPERKI